MATAFDAQLQKLMDKEKIARINSEHFASVTILKDIVSLCYNSRNYAKLLEMIKFLMNRRGQGKKAQIEMIQLAMTWLPQMAQPQKTCLVETIRDVCAKKIFLEVQYARCVLLIVKSKESDNDIMQAANILQEVQVETYGSMDKREKLEFILYQMKIMLKKKDYVRLFIISKKINENNINDDEIADIKISFYSYMVTYHLHHHNYAQLCRAYRILTQTLKKTKKIIPEFGDFHFNLSLQDVEANYIGFLVLQPYTPQIEKELRELSTKEDLERKSQLLLLINNFLSEELISCDGSHYSLPYFQLFREEYPHSGIHREELKKMLVQHNVRIISKYYGCLTLKRISELLGVEKNYCEEQLCDLNNRKVISCRVDRIDDTVDFMPLENQSLVMQNWNSAINNVLDLVDIASNLIHREREVYKK